MLKGIVSVAVVSLATVFASHQAIADTLDDIKGRGALVCGVLTGYEPYSYQEQNTRQLVGYEIDLCAELAKYLGVKSEPKAVTTQGRIPELTQSCVDILAARISYSKERAQQVDYTGVYDVGMDRFMTMKSSGLTGSDFKNQKRISVSKGSPLDQFLREKYPNSTNVSFDDISLVYAAMKAGKIDGILAPMITMVALQQKDPDGQSTAIRPDNIYPIETSFIVRKGEDRLRQTINAKTEESGLAAKIFDKHLGDGSVYKLKREFKLGTPPNS
jgi:polar amino acid transport system substrate-binding protein